MSTPVKIFLIFIVTFACVLGCVLLWRYLRNRNSQPNYVWFNQDNPTYHTIQIIHLILATHHLQIIIQSCSEIRIFGGYSHSTITKYCVFAKFMMIIFKNHYFWLKVNNIQPTTPFPLRLYKYTLLVLFHI